MVTVIVQAARPEELKTALDALIAGGRDIVQVVELTNRSYYLIIHKATVP